MEWHLKYKKDAYRFLFQHSLLAKFEKELIALLKREKTPHIKKLRGDLEGHYRLRIGKVRVIFKIDFFSRIIYVKKADFRGNIYK